MTPRPAILFAVAYWAGLSTGLLRFGAPLGVTLLTLALALAARPLGPVLAGGVLAGRLVGELAAALEREQCTVRLPAERLRMTVAVLDPVDSAGGRTTVAPRAGCRGTVAARWPRGIPVGSGVQAEVVARWVPREGLAGRPGGTLIVSTARVGEFRPGAGDRLRNFIYGANRRLYGARAGVVDALILGRRGGIDREL